MKVLKLYTWLDASEALKMIELCDVLRDQLIEQYGEQIRQKLREAEREKTEDIRHWLDLEDDPF